MPPELYFKYTFLLKDAKLFNRLLGTVYLTYTNKSSIALEGCRIGGYEIILIIEIIRIIKIL
jgi:hypothetical protein